MKMKTKNTLFEDEKLRKIKSERKKSKIEEWKNCMGTTMNNFPNAIGGRGILNLRYELIY